MAEFSENTRVKFPGIFHLMKLGYKYERIIDHPIDLKTNIFIDIFKSALERINGDVITDDVIKDIIKKIQKITAFDDNGKAFYERLIHPSGEIKLVDFENINNNTFSVVTELPFGIDEKFRPDIIVLINGIPLGFIEVKKPNNEGGIKVEFDRMLNDRLPNEQFKRYFNILQIMSFSNNMPYLEIGEVCSLDSVEKKQGSFYSTANGRKMEFNYFREEIPYDEFITLKEIDIEAKENVLKDNNKSIELLEDNDFIFNSQDHTPLNDFLNSLYSRERFMYFLEYGIIFDGNEKHIMRYSQFFASYNVLQRIMKSYTFEREGKNEESKIEKRGIIWHTQGSGKTELAAFISNILRNFYKSKGIITRVFFVVDRLDLLNQASFEIGNRGFAITPINTKVDFIKELKKPISTTERQDNTNEIAIVNIQRIMTDDTPLEEIENPYDVKVQRIIFVDEAHRSFKNGGTFLGNLMTVDRNAVYIALTGTPILNKKERSTLKFGSYFHKYFYDKSIADGYTLKIKLEPIETKFKNIIRRNIEIEEGSIESKEITTRDNYLNPLAKYIEDDFINFRLLNNDNTLGGMIVANSSLQAEKLQAWFEKNSELRTALVLDDTPNNKEKQDDYKKTDKNPLFVKYDLLIVFYMLTTGFDAHRLKKMYLLRKADNHGLLQTISRVNRTYTNPKTKYNYNYGYIVDFAGIQDKLDRTIDTYKRELQEDQNDFDEQMDFSFLITDINGIKDKYNKLYSELTNLIDITSLEEFSIQLSRYNKDTVLKIRRLLEDIKSCYVEFRLSYDEDFVKTIDINRFNKLLKETNNRIKFINILERPVETIKADYLSNEEIVVMFFEFIKLQSYVIDLSKLVENDDTNDTIKSLIDEIKKSKGAKDPRMVKLDEELRKVLNRLMMKEAFDVDNFNNELEQINKELIIINEEHERLYKKFDYDNDYVEAFYDCVSSMEDIDKESLEEFMIECKKSIDEVLNTNKSMYRTKDIFVRTIKYSVSDILDDKGIYDKLDLMNNFDLLLQKIYQNITLIK